MKYPTNNNPRRKRVCANSLCGIEFCPANNKAIYCSLECKNEATQIRLLEKFGQEYVWFKQYIHNIKVLEYFYLDGKYFVTDEMLDTAKFNRPVGKLPELVDKAFVLFYGPYMLCKLSDKKYQIIKIEES